MDLNISPHLIRLYNPRVLEEAAQRIAEREAADSYLYSRYLALHAEHIMSEVTRRAHGNNAQEDHQGASEAA